MARQLEGGAGEVGRVDRIRSLQKQCADRADSQNCKPTMASIRIFSLAFCLFLEAVYGLDSTVPYEFFHHSNEAMLDLMQSYATNFSHIARLYSIGTSVEGRELYAIEISDNVGVHELGEPEFKYVANIHGNEVTGRETLLSLMQYLCERYDTDESVRELVDSTRIHLLTSMNPDGYVEAVEGDELGITGRFNANNYDLNRNFPDRFGRSTGPIQPETQAVIDWIDAYPFVLSANMHNGALVANYPYDNTREGLSVYSESPDDDIFIQLSRAYSFAHGTMYIGEPCPNDSDGFTDGITNGADWYNVDGGMQDYNYVNSNCFEITIEQGCFKYPYTSQLEGLWELNKEALVAYIWQVHNGIAGFVNDLDGEPIPNAAIDVLDRDHLIYTTNDGEYWRLLSPGTYLVAAYADGYTTDMQTVQVPSLGKTNLNFILLRSSDPPSPSPSPNSLAINVQASTIIILITLTLSLF